MAYNEVSHIAPRDVRPFVFGKDEVAGVFPALNKFGIGLDESDVRGMMSAMDAIPALNMTTASIAAPVQFLQSWLPGYVKLMTAARKIDELVGITTVGRWHDEEVVQGAMETTGVVVPYGDYTNVPLSDWDVNFERRTIVRFESGFRVGTLEEARSSEIRVNSAESKRESASLALEIQRNLVGFNGYNSGNNRTYGILNDAALPAYGSIAAGASTYTTWAKKTFLEITADIRTAIVDLRTQSQDTVDPEKTPITMGVATACVDRLSVVSDFGISVRDWLTKTYPNVRVVSAPQFSSANGGANVFYMFAESVDDLSSDDRRTFVQAVPAKAQVLGVQKLAKGYEEDYSNATAGVILKRPYAIVRYTGI